MRKTRVLTLIAAATATLGLATAAAAATTIHVRAGSAPAGTTVGFSVRSTGAISFTDATSSQTATCTKLTSVGSTKTGAHSSVNVAGVSGPRTKLTGCNALNGLEKFASVGYNRWTFSIGSITNGIAYGTLHNVKAVLTGSGFAACKFTMTGTLGARYNNSTHRLVVPGSRATLTVSNSSCPLISNGDKLKIKATLIVTATNAAYRPITFRLH